MEAIVRILITTIGGVITALIARDQKSRKSQQEEILGSQKVVLDEVKDIKRVMRLNNALTIVTGRADIERIYAAGKPNRTITQTAWRVVCDIYTNYKGLPTDDGKPADGYVDAMYDEMKGWKKI